VADNKQEQPKAGWRFREARNSFAIAQSKTPLIFISEKSAASCGAMAKYITESFPHTPIVFENEIAENKFMRATGAYQHEAAHRVIGVCDIDSGYNSVSSSEFTGSDCIIVFGTPKPDAVMALHEMKDETRSVVISQTIQSVDTYVPTAGVNIPQINEIVQRESIQRTPDWLQKIRSMRPSLA
jgi:hypothetical protein